MKKDNLVILIEKLLKTCGGCERYETCSDVHKFKNILNIMKDIELTVLNFKRKSQIIFILEGLILAVWIYFGIILNIQVTNYSILLLIGVLGSLMLYSIKMRYEYKKEQTKKLFIFGDAIGIPIAKQIEIQRCIENKPTSIAKKMMSCDLRKKYGSNYCVKCPESYSCAMTF